MQLTPIIQTPMETDAYKFSMGQCIFHQFNNYMTEWTFRCRNKDVKFTPDMVKEISEQIDHFCSLSFSNEELQWLEINLPWIHRDYLDYLRLWRPNRNEIIIGTRSDYDNDCGLGIKAYGTWLNTSMYEIAILAIVNEVYFAFKYGEGKKYAECIRRTKDHLNRLVNTCVDTGICGGEIVFSEFGMRRRYSKTFQNALIDILSGRKRRGELHGFVGTSNVHLAKAYCLKAVGTQAHEFIMCVGQGNHKHNPAYSNWYAMDAWIKEYGVLNGIALTDTLSTDLFLHDFGLTYATLFSGVRHDSGDPKVWGDKIIEHYQQLGIDPKTKTLLFSDSLNFDRALELFKYFTNRCKVAFGIGTFLSNPLDDPLNIVMKVTECNGCPVAKLSDVEGKGMCKDEEYLSYLKRSIKWRIEHEDGTPF